MAGKTWSEKSIKILEQLSAAGCTYAEAGRVLGRSPESVKSKASNLRLPMNNNEPEIDMDLFKRILKERGK
jgi:hypothetical protein